MREAFRAVAAALLVMLPACEGGEQAAASAATSKRYVAGEPIEPLPTQVTVRSDRAALGEKLFKDPILSASGSVACVTCHLYEYGGAEPHAFSRTSGGRDTSFNTPSIFNIPFNFRFSWTGAFTSIDAQLDQAFARTMGVDLPGVVRRLQKHAYAEEFEAAYPDGLTEQNLRDALTVFVTSLVTPDARFDRFLRGERNALNEDEKQGYLLFKDLGCASCHQGANVGGNLFQRMGIAEDYFMSRGTPITSADEGRFAITGDPADRHVFRVPSLRNVERTAPYFHDGSAKTLDDAIVTMARFQLGRDVPAEDRARIAAFLRTLTGTFRGKPL
jgi:cytochrome c peroxidase